MANRILIIVTRKTGTEFQQYWNGDETNTIPIDNPKFSKTLYRQIKDDRIIIVNGVDLPEDNTLFGERLMYIIDISNLNIDGEIEGKTVGIISHKGAKNPDISPISSHVSFNKKYSSSEGEHFCEYGNDKFVAIHNRPENPRKGFFDAFRDEFIFADNDENLHAAFDNLWKYFEGNTDVEVILKTLHTCLTPEGAIKVQEIEGFDSIKETDIEGEKLYDYIDNHLVTKSNNEALSEGYVKPLAKMRDVLLSTI